jgi:hypothetical protein
MLESHLPRLPVSINQNGWKAGSSEVDSTHSQRHKVNALKLPKKAAPRGEQRLHCAGGGLRPEFFLII